MRARSQAPPVVHGADRQAARPRAAGFRAAEPAPGHSGGAVVYVEFCRRSPAAALHDSFLRRAGDSLFNLRPTGRAHPPGHPGDRAYAFRGASGRKQPARLHRLGPGNLSAALSGSRGLVARAPGHVAPDDRRRSDPAAARHRARSRHQRQARPPAGTFRGAAHTGSRRARPQVPRRTRPAGDGSHPGRRQ